MEVDSLIIPCAKSAALDPILVKAIVFAESSTNAKSARYERLYTYLVTPEVFAKKNGISIDTETVFQKTSWGLMQIMGAAARERGFETWLPDLCDPTLGLIYGCKHLAWFSSRFKTRDEIISAWNAGTPKKLDDGTFKNQPYVNRVKSFYLQFGGKC